MRTKGQIQKEIDMLITLDAAAQLASWRLMDSDPAMAQRYERRLADYRERIVALRNEQYLAPTDYDLALE